MATYVLLGVHLVLRLVQAALNIKEDNTVTITLIRHKSCQSEYSKATQKKLWQNSEFAISRLIWHQLRPILWVAFQCHAAVNLSN